MSAEIFDGRAFSEKIYKSLKARVQKLKARGIVPGLVIFSTKGSLAAESFVRSKMKDSGKIGIVCRSVQVSSLGGSKNYARAIEATLKDKNIHALILLKPLPDGADIEQLESLIGPEKDAEGLNPAHFGRLFSARDFDEIKEKRLIVPATALAIAEILKGLKFPFKGKKALVIGRSNIVGNPAAHLLTMMDLTVTLAHSKTRNLRREVGESDIVVSAVGSPHLIKGSWIKKGALVIDAGTSAVKGKLTGDVDSDGALKKAAWITPVPGGVGPVTTACLLRNVVFLAERAFQK